MTIQQSLRTLTSLPFDSDNWSAIHHKAAHHIDSLQKQLAEAKALLTKHQWKPSHGRLISTAYACIECGFAMNQGDAPDFALAAMVKEDK